jgi:tetratricopeptide (TPR) repeat protein
MKQKLIILTVFVSILAFGTYWITRKPPELETKFVQNVSQQGLKATTEPEGTETRGAEFKKPGDYALVDDTKHIYQTFNNCGPATLSMVLAWFGENVSQKELGDAMRPYQNAQGDNDDKTIFTYEFVDWVKKYGLEAIDRPNGDISLLKTFTANGIPVVVKTWLHVGEDIGHFRIVRGFDETKQVIIQDDSYEGPNKKISYYDFLSMWQPFNYAYIIVYTPDQQELVEAIIDEEMKEDVAWSNALERAKREAELDEGNAYPVFNMSTAYYHLSDYKASVEAFEKVEAKLPRRMLWYQIEPILSYQALGNYDRVFQVTASILENGNRAFSELYQIRGEIYLQQGDKGKAREQFELALKYNSNYSPASDALQSL